MAETTRRGFFAAAAGLAAVPQAVAQATGPQALVLTVDDVASKMTSGVSLDQAVTVAVKSKLPVGEGAMAVYGTPALAQSVLNKVSGAKVYVVNTTPITEAFGAGAPANVIDAFGANGAVSRFPLADAMRANGFLMMNPAGVAPTGVTAPAQGRGGPTTGQPQQAQAVQQAPGTITPPTFTIEEGILNRMLAANAKTANPGHSPLNDLAQAQAKSQAEIAQATATVYDVTAVTGNNTAAYEAAQKAATAQRAIAATQRLGATAGRLTGGLGGLGGRGFDKEGAAQHMNTDAVNRVRSGGVVLVTFEDSRTDKTSDLTAEDIKRTLQEQGKTTQLPSPIAFKRYDSEAGPNKDAQGYLRDKAAEGFVAVYGAQGFITALNRAQVEDGSLAKLLAAQVGRPRAAADFIEGPAAVIAEAKPPVSSTQFTM